MEDPIAIPGRLGRCGLSYGHIPRRRCPRAQGDDQILQDVTATAATDKAALFLDGLHFPTVSCPAMALGDVAPYVFYAEDTDGDGRADRR